MCKITVNEAKMVMEEGRAKMDFRKHWFLQITVVLQKRKPYMKTYVSIN